MKESIKVKAQYKQFGMGRLPSPFDARDYTLGDFIPKLTMRIVTNKLWEFLEPEPLNQESTPHCVGFSMANFMINLPTYNKKTNEDGHRFYYLCKVQDGDPEAEDGSNLRSACKVLKNLKRINGYAFASNIAQVKYWLLNKGPLIAGTVWTEDMFKPDYNNIIHPTGTVAGGHAYLLNEWTKDGYIGIQNSWGNLWGKSGKAYIKDTDFAELLRQGGEALASVELPIAGCRR